MSKFNKQDYDFCGYATRFDTECDDGVVILHTAFQNQDGERVTLADNHGHKVTDSLGYVDLEIRHDGVYCYGSLNDTQKGKDAKTALQHGDFTGLSIWANKLVHGGMMDIADKSNPGKRKKAKTVSDGQIREVSLVMSGCNPGAIIDYVNPAIAHGFEPPETLEGRETDVAQIWPYETDFIEVIRHDGTDKEDEKMAEENKKPETEDDEIVDIEDPQAVWDSMDKKQQQLCKNIVGNVLAEQKDSKKEEGNDMPRKGEISHNAFMSDAITYDGATLAHDAFGEIIAGGKANGGSVKDYYLAHSQDISADYGVADIGQILDEYTALNQKPERVRDVDESWVSEVLSGVTNTVFSRMKMRFIDFTNEEDFKAKGYITTHRKKDSVMRLFKRVRAPHTMYIKTKIDRDELIDLEETGLDYIPVVKAEMELKLDELKALCYLLGDGLEPGTEDHVPEECVTPIVSDEALFSRKFVIEVAANATPDEKAKAFIRAVRKKRRFYRGSGNPVMMVPEELLSDMLNLEDTNQHYLYEDETKLARTLRVSKIVGIPPMEGAKMVDNEPESATKDTVCDLCGIMVNMKDYIVGMNKLGKKTMFEDFDINYNQMTWLLETRQSAGLYKPFSALCFGFHTQG